MEHCVGEGIVLLLEPERTVVCLFLEPLSLLKVARRRCLSRFGCSCLSLPTLSSLLLLKTNLDNDIATITMETFICDSNNSAQDVLNTKHKQ